MKGHFYKDVFDYDFGRVFVDGPSGGPGGAEKHDVHTHGAEAVDRENENSEVDLQAAKDRQEQIQMLQAKRDELEKLDRGAENLKARLDDAVAKLEELKASHPGELDAEQQAAFDAQVTQAKAVVAEIEAEHARLEGLSGSAEDESVLSDVHEKIQKGADKLEEQIKKVEGKLDEFLEPLGMKVDEAAQALSAADGDQTPGFFEALFSDDPIGGLIKWAEADKGLVGYVLGALGFIDPLGPTEDEEAKEGEESKENSDAAQEEVDEAKEDEEEYVNLGQVETDRLRELGEPMSKVPEAWLKASVKSAKKHLGSDIEAGHATLDEGVAMIWAIITHEAGKDGKTGFNASSRNAKSSVKGLAQVWGPTWKEYLKANGHRAAEKDPDNPLDAIDFVAWYIKHATEQARIKWYQHEGAKHAYLTYHHGPDGYRDHQNNLADSSFVVQEPSTYAEFTSYGDYVAHFEKYSDKVQATFESYKDALMPL